MRDKERRPNKRYKMKENKKYPYKHREDFIAIKPIGGKTRFKLKQLKGGRINGNEEKTCKESSES
jgi:hypothetical protein